MLLQISEKPWFIEIYKRNCGKKYLIKMNISIGL